MMPFRTIIISTVLFVLGRSAQGQDIHVTQFYSAPTFLNPAFSGANVCSRVTLLHRDQWPGIKRAYKTSLLAIDHSFNKMGVGLNVVNDAAGSGHLKTIKVDPVVSYGVNLSREASLRFGIQSGIEIQSLDYSKLLFGDQVYRGGDVPSFETPIETRYRPDLGTGVLFNTAYCWAGFSMYHLLGTNNSFYRNRFERTPARLSFHAGYKFMEGGRSANALSPKQQAMRKSLTIVINYNMQKEFDQLDIGTYFSKSIFVVGLWYRGIPFLKSYKPGYSNHDAVAVLVGLSKDRLNIGYSYDITISRLSTSAPGAHEITLSYQLCKLPKKNPKRRLKLISCPKF